MVPPQSIHKRVRTSATTDSFEELKLRRWPVSRSPLWSEDRVGQLVGPFALHEFVLHEVGLSSHTQLLEHARRGDIPCVQTSAHSMCTETRKGQLDDHRRTLGRVATSGEGWIEYVADFVVLMCL